MGIDDDPASVIHAVHCWSPPMALATSTTPFPVDEFEQIAEELLARVLDRAPPGSVTRTSETVLAVSFAATLLERAAEADLLVIGSGARSTADRLLGSVTTQCAQNTPCPLVAVPAEPVGGDTIVAAFDGSDASKPALEWAAAVAARRSRPLRVVGVWEAVNVMGAPRLAADAELLAEQVELELRDQVRAVIGDAVDGAELRAIRQEGRVASVLVEQAADAGLLVVGSRGRGGFTGLLLGSVSQRCLETSDVPVAVVRAG